MEDLTGRRFGRWVVLGFSHTDKSKHYWMCKCDCGIEKPVNGYNLVRGATKSCGCYKLELFINMITNHGMTGSRAFTIWMSMKQRCDNPMSHAYSYYGGRGIDYDPRWSEFENFYEDMGDPPPGNTLERIDNNRGYWKDNCVWATRVEQANNKRNNKNITYGDRTQSEAAWSREVGVKRATIAYRLKKGHTVEYTLFEPLHKNGYT